MKTFSVRLAAGLVLALGVLGIATEATAGQRIKVATIAPEGTEWMRKMRAGADEIEARTEGRVEFKFYGGGVMGNDKKVLRKIRFGQLHGGAFTSAGLAERYKDVQLYGLPLLFQSLDEVGPVRKSMDARIEAGLAEAGLASFGFAEGGFAVLMSNEPVRNLDDLRGKKVWVPEGDEISYKTMERLGLAPVVLPITDVLTGLQTGLIDIIASSAVGAVVLQWHTKVKYVTELPLSYIFATLVVDQKIMQRLSAEDRAIVDEVMREVYAGFDKQFRVDEAGATEALRESGIQFVQPDADKVPEWRRLSAEIRRDLAAEGRYSAELLREIEAQLTDYRASASAAAQ